MASFEWWRSVALRRAHALSASIPRWDAAPDTIAAYGLAQRPHTSCATIIRRGPGSTAYSPFRRTLIIVPETLIPDELPLAILHEAAHAGQPQIVLRALVVLQWVAYAVLTVFAVFWPGVPNWTADVLCGLFLAGGRALIEYDADVRAADWLLHRTALPTWPKRARLLRARLWSQVWDAASATWLAPVLVSWFIAALATGSLRL